MTRAGLDELPTVDNWEDVPAFANEDEEADFWATHGLGGAALESLGTLDDDALPPPRPRRRHIVMYTREFSRQITARQSSADRAASPLVSQRRWLVAS